MANRQPSEGVVEEMVQQALRIVYAKLALSTVPLIVREDIYAEARLKVLLTIRRDPCRPGGYYAMTAWNRAIEVLRTEKRCRAASLEIVAEDGDVVEAYIPDRKAAVQFEQIEDMDYALSVVERDRAGDQMRESLLRYANGESWAEIIRDSGEGPMALKARLWKFRERANQREAC